ncbi:CHRD domain-containing protein [Oceanobacillus halophilus]|uniref:CHRD domain-containing protein n=1 Tax=Oceanobacillus halophilus TaxID=930130 RepID=A0A494ZVR2_9BACI|nr:CHRD domain-containing protein [Oceanobacillus halophilus]RKQ30506.1 CHRD domain-containing protein [Oceanobacillus halophilus]
MYNDHFFMTQLTGSKEVPPVHTNADGLALFHFDTRKNMIRFRLDVNDIGPITQANIHLGNRNIVGPIVAIIFEPEYSQTISGKKVIEGVIRERDLVGPLSGKSLSELIREMKVGKAFVNIQTSRYPKGEVRGKISQN